MTKEELLERLTSIKNAMLLLRKNLQGSADILEHRSNAEFLMRLENMCGQDNEMIDFILEESIEE